MCSLTPQHHSLKSLHYLNISWLSHDSHDLDTLGENNILHLVIALTCHYMPLFKIDLLILKMAAHILAFEHGTTLDHHPLWLSITIQFSNILCFCCSTLLPVLYVVVKSWMSTHKLKSLGMPLYISSGLHETKDGKYRFMIIPQYKSDLQSLFIKCNKRFPVKTVINIMLQVVSTFIVDTHDWHGLVWRLQ